LPQFHRAVKAVLRLLLPETVRPSALAAYGYEHVLRAEEAVLSVARYIVENPLRAKLTDDVRQYAFLGSAVYSVDEILDALPWEPPKYRSR
jgi:hypothetical protein